MIHQPERKCAKVTRKGILLNNLYYSCSLAIREGWFEKAALKGGWRVPVVVESLGDGKVCIPLNNELIPCYRIEAGTDKSAKIEAYFESIRVLKEYRKKHRESRE